MKAKEYYEKYKDIITYEEVDNQGEIHKILKALTADIIEETFELKDKRNVTTPEGLASIIKEQNGKWNALIRIFIKKHGRSPFREDGYKNVVLAKVPEMKRYLE